MVTGGAFGSLHVWKVESAGKGMLQPVAKSPNAPFCSQSKIILLYHQNANQIRSLNENGIVYSWNVNVSNGKISAFHIAHLENNDKNYNLKLTHAVIHPFSSLESSCTNLHSNLLTFEGIVAADELGNLLVSGQVENADIIPVEKYPRVHDGLAVEHLVLNADGKLLLTTAEDGWLKVWTMERVNGKGVLELYRKYRFTKSTSIVQVKWVVDNPQAFTLIDSDGKVYQGVCNQSGIQVTCIFEDSQSDSTPAKDIELWNNCLLVGRDFQIKILE